MNAQEPILSIPANESLKKSDQFFIIKNEAAQEFVSIIIKNNEITAIHIDNSFTVQSELKTPFAANLGRMIARDFVNGFYTIYFYNRTHGKLHSLRFDFENATTDVTIKNIPTKKQNFVKGFAHNDHFYLVNILQRTSKLRFYVFAPDGTMTTHEVEYPDYFRDPKRRASNLYENLSFNNSRLFIVPHVDEELPTPISVSGHFSKMYLEDSMLIITADANPLYTYIIYTDLDSFEGNVDVFGKRALQNTIVVTKNNSFLADDLLYSLATNNDEMYIDIWDIETRAKVKELSFSKNEDVFLAHPIIDDGIIIRDQEERLKMSKLLSNMVAGTKGISIKKMNDNFLFIIGSTRITGHATLGMGAEISGPFDTVGYSVDDLETRGEIVAYFDKDYNLIDRPIDPNAFDDIRILSEAADFKKLDTFFKLKDTYVFAYIMHKTGKINFFISEGSD